MISENGYGLKAKKMDAISGPRIELIVRNGCLEITTAGFAKERDHLWSQGVLRTYLSLS
jgi:hypothetical protein